MLLLDTLKNIETYPINNNLSLRGRSRGFKSNSCHKGFRKSTLFKIQKYPIKGSFLWNNISMRWKFIFLLSFVIFACGPSEEEIQSQIDTAVEQALETSTTSTTIPATNSTSTSTTAILESKSFYEEVYEKEFYFLLNSSDYLINSSNYYLRLRATWSSVKNVLLHFSDYGEVCTNYKDSNLNGNKSYIAILINSDIENCFSSKELIAIEIRGENVKNTVVFYNNSTYSDYFDSNIINKQTEFTCCHKIEFEVLNNLFTELKNIYKNPTTTTTTLAPTTTTTSTTTTTLAPTTTSTTTLAPTTTTTTTLACNKRADNTPPKVKSYSINKNSIDVASKSENFIVTLRITDDCIGVELDEILITFGDTGFAYNKKRVSGNSLDGIYEVIVNVPEGHKIGNFEVLLFPVDDENGNTYVPEGKVNGFISIGYVDVK